MPQNTVIARLRKIDKRLADKVSRKRIGSLVGRLWWQSTTDLEPAELPIYQFQDLGTGTAPWAPGASTLAHRYSCRVDGDAYEAIQGLQGEYWVQPEPDGDLLPVEVESQSVPDGQTYAEIGFRVKTEVDRPVEVVEIDLGF